MKKKIFAALLAGVMTLSLAACGGSSAPAASAPAPAAKEEKTEEAAPAEGVDLKVGFVTSAAGANDTGYNRSTVEAIETAAKEYGFEYRIVEPSASLTVGQCIEGLAEDGSTKYDNVYAAMFNVNEAMLAAGLSVTVYVQFQMLENEIEDACNTNGFVYMQAKAAPGQGYINPKYPTLKDCIQGLRDHGIDRPIYCGVGVHAPEDVKMVREAGGDGAFVGSTILKLQDDIPGMKAKIREFIAQC